MLLTITANPSLDRVLHLPYLATGQIHRATNLKLVAAGKGLNVVRAAVTLGTPALATGMLAGRHGQIVAELFQVDGFAADWYWLPAGETRVCTMLNQDSGDTTVINEPGPDISTAEWAGFAAHVQALAQSAQAVVFCGSMPPGVPPDAPGQLARALAGNGLPVYFDVGYQHLPSLLANPRGVCVKVNRAELAAGLGQSFGSGDALAPLIEAGQLLLARGATQVVVTLGGAGALAVSPEGVWQATPPIISVVSTVGSGDSLTAGLVAAQLRGLPLAQALAHGVAAGAANALNNVPGRLELAEFERLLARVRINQY